MTGETTAVRRHGLRMRLKRGEFDDRARDYLDERRPSTTLIVFTMATR
jgi:hypothetical protein